tara:strand:+ start:29125 stop:30015 length:891 start_codon:yes stop_codon:yes gene_type:complete
MNAPAVTSVQEIVSNQEQAFSSVSVDQSVTWAKESQFAMQLLQANKYLSDIAWGNKDSLKNAIINIAAIGISLNPASKHAYLVPRDNKVCLDISYIGLMHLAQQTGSILWGQAKIVYASDSYQNTGIDSPPKHNSSPFLSNKNRGAIVGVYCTVKTKDGSYLTEEMNTDELDKIKAASKAAKGPWKTWPEEMMRKSVVKRASKYWPKVERLDLAIQSVNEHEGIEFKSSDTVAEKEVPKCLSDIQLKTIVDTMAENGVSLDAVLKAAQVEHLADIRTERFDAAIEWIRKQGNKNNG